jgi:hypothetical protein
VAKDRIDEALAALAQAGRDAFGPRREILERTGSELLHRPALGAQIVARLCAVAEPTPAESGLLDLLGAGLDAARIARENGQARGQTLLDSLEDAIDLARRQGRMTATHHLLLAQLWSRNALRAPGGLELQRDEVISADLPRATNPAEGDALLTGLFAELIGQAEGEPLALHAALTESFPAMPVEMRDHVVAYSVARTEPLHADLACFWLLDPAANIRLAAAQGLSGRLARGDLSDRILATLIVLRSWMPEDAARREIDLLLKEAMRRGVPSEAAGAPWVIEAIRATLPDGGGAQSIGIALTSGKHRKMAMLLLKQGQGVKDAYTIPCRSAKEQKAIIDRMTEEVGGLSVTEDYVARAVAVALADGLALGQPPVPGLIEVARLCGFASLRPEQKSTSDLIAGLVSAARVRTLSPRQRDELIACSEDWWDRYDIVESWFEDSDAAQAALDKARGARAAETALWKWLETRRDWWARILARAAEVLEAANPPDAAGFAACAMALIEGHALKKIAVMLDIHEQTIEAWVMDDPDFDPAASLEDLAEDAPAPEKKGEFAGFLRGSELTVDWVDGYLTAVIIAPQMIAPNLWLSPILQAVLPRLDPSKFQRFVDLVMMRTQVVSDQASAPDAFTAAMAARSKKGQADWSRGFSQAVGEFRDAWPKKGMTKEDRRLLEMASVGVGGAELVELAALLARRQAQNLG